MNVVFAASECVPFSKTGGLADVVGALPKDLAELGHSVSVYLPKYKQTKLAEPKVLEMCRVSAFQSEIITSREPCIASGHMHDAPDHRVTEGRIFLSSS